MRKILFFVLLTTLSCATPESKIGETEVVETIEGFFSALDMDNKDPHLMNRYVTEDFIIYEAGKKMSKQEFSDFVSWGPSMQETTWELSDFRISLDGNSAHASLLNNGTFTSQTDSLRLARKLTWLESAYLVKVNDTLKIKFYFSDRVNVSTDTLSIN